MDQPAGFAIQKARHDRGGQLASDLKISAIAGQRGELRHRHDERRLRAQPDLVLVGAVEDDAVAVHPHERGPDHEVEAGRHTLDGRQALQYVRVRKSVGDGSDLGRIERQQAFLSSVMQQATSTQLLVQPNRLFSFLDAATKSLTTDPEFGVGTMRDMATSVKGIGLDEIQFVTLPTEYFPRESEFWGKVAWTGQADEIWKLIAVDKELPATLIGDTSVSAEGPPGSSGSPSAGGSESPSDGETTDEPSGAQGETTDTEDQIYGVCS